MGESESARVGERKRAEVSVCCPFVSSALCLLKNNFHAQLGTRTNTHTHPLSPNLPLTHTHTQPKLSTVYTHSQDGDI